MQFFIRTDASSAMGLGHLLRCLSLAHALRRLDAEVRFAIRASDVDAASLVIARGFAVRTLPRADATGTVAPLPSDADEFCALWPNESPAWVLVDHYGLDAAWHARVRASLGCRIAAIDDLADRPLALDALIDPNFVAAPGHRAKYAQVLSQAPAAWLCGPRFALLGPAYTAAAPFELSPEVRSIGIFLGGTDPAGLSLAALRACREVAGFAGPVEVVSTSGNPRLSELQAQVARDARATLSLDLPDLAGFFRRHDLQIGAGGGATWERCCIGVPTLTLSAADNQRAVVPALQAIGALATTRDNSVAAIGGALLRLIGSPDERRALSERSRALVDGRGAERAALALAARTAGPLALRPAAMADAALMWRWRNHPATRAVSRSALPIPLQAHETWLAQTLATDTRVLWVGHVGTVDVGVIRFDRLASGRHEVSLYLDPALHGLGLGAALLQAGEQALAVRLGAVTVQAEVLAGNPASLRLFAAAGYRNEGPLRLSKRVAPAVAPKGVRQPETSR